MDGEKLREASVGPGELVLVTGGAGFIGSHTVDLLLEKGYRVRILDILQPRVHPQGKPKWVPAETEFIQGDVASPADLAGAFEGAGAVFHLAAYQDYMQDFSTFIHTNTESAALLFELAVADPRRFPARKIVFASSQSVSGEGRYWCNGGKQDGAIDRFVRRQDPEKPEPGGCGVICPGPRPVEQLRRADWEVRCPRCGHRMQPLRIDESTIYPHTTYAISKYAIEMLADRLGRRYGIATACMRYTYVQGTRNSFYNAYSGIARRFALRILNGLPPVVYEDGGQLRDYVNVRDVARANVLVLERPEADFGVFNVGGGRPVTVLEFAHIMLEAFGSPMEPQVAGEFRLGDTRHTISDIAAIERLGWKPTVPVEQNVREYTAWLREQPATAEYLERAEESMRKMGVVQTASV